MNATLGDPSSNTGTEQRHNPIAAATRPLPCPLSTKLRGQLPRRTRWECQFIAESVLYVERAPTRGHDYCLLSQSSSRVHTLVGTSETTAGHRGGFTVILESAFWTPSLYKMSRSPPSWGKVFKRAIVICHLLSEGCQTITRIQGRFTEHC